MFYEPQETQYDLKFQMFGIPVRIHPMFWLLTVLLAMNAPPAILLLWILAVTASILIHELGHALVMRLYGINPHIVLYSFGGLTVYDRIYHLRWFENIFISFAGPAAGFLFLGLVTIGCCLMGQTQILGYFPLVLRIPGAQFIAIGGEFSSMLLLFLVEVNLIWGILNLMPIFPLDGGQIVREYCMNASPGRGLYNSTKISFVTAVILIVFALSNHQVFLALLFGWMAFSNYQIMKQIS